MVAFGKHLPVRAVKALFFALLIGFIALAAAGYFAPVRNMLDSEALSITMGESRISVYLILKGMLALGVVLWLAGTVAGSGERWIHRIDRLNLSHRALVSKLFQILIYFIAVLIGLDMVGIDLTALAVLGGAVGIGLGFGLQKIASNFISGLILLLEQNIKRDDLIELVDGTTGYIRHTGARATIVEAVDGREILVPNEEFITSRVINWTYSTTRARAEIKVGVGYDSDLELARKLMIEAAQAHPRCSQREKPACFVENFGDSAITLVMYVWVDDVRDGRLDIRSDTMMEIWKRFREHKISIPFPQREARIISDAGK